MSNVDPESAFGKLLVEQGLVQPAHVAECLRERRELIERGASPVPGLGELLVRRGYLRGRGRGFTLTRALVVLVIGALVAVIATMHLRQVRDARRVEEARTRAEAEGRAKPHFDAGSARLVQTLFKLYLPGESPERIQQEAREAHRLLEEAASIAPHMAASHDLLARAWDVQGRRTEAERCWRRAIELEPSYAPARLGLGILLVEAALLADGRPEGRRFSDEAARVLAGAWEGALTSDTDRWICRVALLHVQGRRDEAVERVEEALRLVGARPGVERLYWLRGLLATAPERPAWFDRAIAIRPHFALAYFCRARTRQSIEDYTRAIQLQSSFAEAHLGRARLRRDAGDIPAAIDDLRRAIDVAPPDWPWRGDVLGEIEDLRRR